MFLLKIDIINPIINMTIIEKTSLSTEKKNISIIAKTNKKYSINLLCKMELLRFAKKLFRKVSRE
jgi:hypothetical protein